MTTFNEPDHPRTSDGRFAPSSSSESSAVLEQAPTPVGWHADNTDGVPDVNGRPFAEVFAEHFKPLDDFESEHGEYAPAERVTAERLMEHAGLAGRNFGRMRGISVELRQDDWTEEETGPFLVVHTRNGSGNREHYGEDTEPGPACDCTGCVQTYQIPGYPGYVDDEDDDGDYTYANNFFELPTLPPDGDYPTDTAQRLQLDELKRARELVQTGALRPWHFLARRADRDPKPRWPGFSQPSDLQWACSGHPQPEIFFPNPNRDLSAAKKICSDCPAKLMCGRAGVESLESGVWGGTLLHNGVPNNRLFTREYPGAGRKKATTQSA